VDSEDSEEEIGVERTERHVIKSDSDSETYVAMLLLVMEVVVL